MSTGFNDPSPPSRSSPAARTPPAGFTYGAIKMRSPVAPFILGLIGGVAAGGADAWDRLSPSTAELGVKTDPRYDGAVAPSPQSLAASSSLSSSVSARLIK
jgi:hypothetical protein